MNSPLRVLALHGSLRQGSYNRSALLSCIAEAPPGLAFDLVDDIGFLPNYCEDVRLDTCEPACDLFERVAAADALLIATPEYNHSIPGVLKNFLDWLSRAPGQPIRGKTAAIIGASTGVLGTLRAQAHLRDILQGLDVHVINKPEVLIGLAHTKIGPDGMIADPIALSLMATLLEGLQEQTSMRRRHATLQVR